MRTARPSLILAAMGVVALAVWAGAQADRSGPSMGVAAGRFLAALDAGQAAKARFAYDDPERLNWHFIPRARKGLPIKEMTPEQRALAFGLIESGLGAAGSLKATTIMSLEAILLDMEKGRGPVRDPELYFVSIFGDPTNRGAWGWRVEGHHLSLNFTLKDGAIVAATPAFFGANPAEVRDGPRQGLRTLADVEDRALRLLQALDADQQKVAIVAATAPADIASNSGPVAGGGLPSKPAATEPQGIAADRLTADQRQMLRSLVEAYAASMPDDVAMQWLKDVDAAGTGLHFAWTGAADRTQPHGYTVQGPGFLIEFNNTQNNANHIHSLWRNTLGDFGLAAK
jgi:hypothetical protein